MFSRGQYGGGDTRGVEQVGGGAAAGFVSHRAGAFNQSAELLWIEVRRRPPGGCCELVWSTVGGWCDRGG
jgi:hypothetical protein